MAIIKATSGAKTQAGYANRWAQKDQGKSGRMVIKKRKIIVALFSMGMAAIWLFVTVRVMRANSNYESQTKSFENGNTILPLIQNAYPSPAGSYLCHEYEFGLIWLTEVITLNADGISSYYGAAAGNEILETNIVTGSWVYTPSIQRVGFTNFRWITATYESPNRIWARKYLDYAGFEIGLECRRRPNNIQRALTSSISEGNVYEKRRFEPGRPGGFLRPTPGAGDSACAGR